MTTENATMTDYLEYVACKYTAATKRYGTLLFHNSCHLIQALSTALGKTKTPRGGQTI